MRGYANFYYVFLLHHHAKMDGPIRHDGNQSDAFAKRYLQYNTKHSELLYCRADAKLALSQWETLLQNDTISHFLGINLESSLVLHWYRHNCFKQLAIIVQMVICMVMVLVRKAGQPLEPCNLVNWSPSKLGTHWGPIILDTEVAHSFNGLQIYLCGAPDMCAGQQ